MDNNNTVSKNRIGVAQPSSTRKNAAGFGEVDPERVANAQLSAESLRTQIAVQRVPGDGAFGTVSNVSRVMGLGGAVSRGGTATSVIQAVQNKTPIVQVPGYSRATPGEVIGHADDTTTYVTAVRGATVESRELLDRSQVIKIYQDFPADEEGNPTGYRLTVINIDRYGDKDVEVYSIQLHDSAGDDLEPTVHQYNGIQFANQDQESRFDRTDDIAEMIDIMNLAELSDIRQVALQATTTVMTPVDGVFDDYGNQLHNITYKNADGSTMGQVVHQWMQDLDPSHPLDRERAYLSTFMDVDGDGNATVTKVLKTHSWTDIDGMRVTTIQDVTDPDPTKHIQLSATRIPDPIIKASRETGGQMGMYLDFLNEHGQLDITGEGDVDRVNDLLLIYRYNNGLRGDDLIANLNLGSASIEDIEARLQEAFYRGIFDVDGSDSVIELGGGYDGVDHLPFAEVDMMDINILARYFMGARGSALLDPREADDDSIMIQPDDANVISFEADDVRLAEFQDIFGIGGVADVHNVVGSTPVDTVSFYVSWLQTPEGGGRTPRQLADPLANTGRKDRVEEAGFIGSRTDKDPTVEGMRFTGTGAIDESPSEFIMAGSGKAEVDPVHLFLTTLDDRLSG